MVAMAGLQVFIVRFFFQGARKGEWLYFLCLLMSLSSPSTIHWNVAVRRIELTWYRLCISVMEGNHLAALG